MKRLISPVGQVLGGGLVSDSISRLRRFGLQHAVPLVFLAACAVILSPKLQALDMALIWSTWNAITPQQWGLSVTLTAISFWAIGQYDVIAHRHLNTGVPETTACQSGMTAVAVSQTLGFGVITATFARWRMLRGFGPGVSALVTVFVSFSFMLAAIGLTALACLLLPMPGWVKVFAGVALLFVIALCVSAVLFRSFEIRGFSVEMPSLRAFSAAFGWAFVDITAACLALWVLVPHAFAPDLLAFFPVFCIALTIGLLSGTPGGVGPFELTLLMFTTVGSAASTPDHSLLVAVMGFRLVYFAIPACLAMLRLLIRPKPLAIWRDPQPPELRYLPRAETAVLRQSKGGVQQLAHAHLGVWKTTQAMVGLFDPDKPANAAMFDQLQSNARRRNRFALMYKTTARTASSARKAGWTTLRIADDAIVDLAEYRIDVPERSRLRRKIRKAEKAGIRVRPVEPHDLTQLATLDKQWQVLHGRARGGTMGRFCPEYLRQQRVFVAEQFGNVIAFISLHCNDQEWTLDLMRHGTDLPDGTMHALAHYAAETAKEYNVSRFCLSAIPACPNPESTIWRALSLRALEWSHGDGLRQFKSSFAPRWTPLYIAAPSWVALCIGTADIVREVFRPAPLPVPTKNSVSVLHKNDENYEVASDVAA